MMEMEVNLRDYEWCKDYSHLLVKSASVGAHLAKSLDLKAWLGRVVESLELSGSEVGISAVGTWSLLGH